MFLGGPERVAYKSLELTHRYPCPESLLSYLTRPNPRIACRGKRAIHLHLQRRLGACREPGTLG
ncbi:hypothetical protein BJX63DRAFT_407854 [Aspergillus granulosus]|uniref:Uncharacterized protein n=1 Tax=Aspergillus granulosus TaxID=176169 RepID=A0ABR4H030_9EURO